MFEDQVGKPCEALAVGFGTLVNTPTIIPTPLLVAQDLVLDASKLDKNQKEAAQSTRSQCGTTRHRCCQSPKSTSESCRTAR
jgi:hypothetical protein